MLKKARLALIASAILAASLAVTGPASATQVTGEALFSNDLLITDSVTGGHDSLQGYKQRGAADFNDKNKPGCAVGTPNSPSGPLASPALGGVLIQGGMGASASSRGPEAYKVSASRTGSGAGWQSQPFSYYLHAERQIQNDVRYICAQAQVTTDANGAFSVTFPYALQAAPVSVVWSAARCVTGSAPCTPASRFVTATSSTGFSARMGTYINSTTWWGPANRTIVIDYMASAVPNMQELDPSGHAKTWTAGNLLVNTDGNGNATIPWSVPAGTFEAGLVTGGMINPNDTGNLSYRNPGSIALTAGTPTSGTIHVRNLAGQVMTSTQIRVWFIAFGTEGGRTMPEWGPNNYTQTGYNASSSLDTCDGVTIGCYRRPSPERTADSAITQQWGTYQDFNDWMVGSGLAGKDPEVWMSENLTKWNNADVDVPNWSRDTTPEANEQLMVNATNIEPNEFGEYPCATAEPILGTAPSAGTGILEWFNHLMTFNTDTNQIVFGKYPLDPQTQNCEISRTILHETGHVYGLGHAPMNGSLMQPVISNVDSTTIPTEAVVNTRAIYGYSGSTASYPVGTKLTTSGIVKPGKGQSVSLVTVASEGPAHRKGPRSVQNVTVTGADNIAGSTAPTTVETPAARLLNADGSETADNGLKVGGRYLMRINADGTLAGFFPVSGDSVQIGHQKSIGVTDDVDGGSPKTVSVTKLKEKAKAA